MIDQTFNEIASSLAARTPTPAGGAAAALTASMGTSLMLMVIRFTRGKKASAAREGDLAAAEAELEGHLQRILPMAERDSASFGHVAAAYGLPKDTERQKAIRQKVIQEAMLAAMVVPEELLCTVRDVHVVVARVADCIGKAIIGDLGSATELLRAAAAAALINVRVNASYLGDRQAADLSKSRARAVDAEIETHYEAIIARLNELQ